MNARDELRRYVKLLADSWTPRETTDERVEKLYAKVRAEVLAEVLPQWEAVYEPGNVSDYLIGYTNDEIPAKRAAEAWFRSQCDTPNEIEWVADPAPPGRHDAWHELIQIDSNHQMVMSTGIIVRHRRAEATS